MASSPIEHLSQYMAKKMSDSSPRIPRSIPWNACFGVLGFVRSLYVDSHGGTLHNNEPIMETIRCLEYKSTELAAIEQNSDEYVLREKEIYDILINSFMPLSQKYFTLPTSDITPLALFVFILFSVLGNPDEPNRVRLQNPLFLVILKELKFLLDVLGDIKLHSCTDARDLLIEFQDVANTIGNFIYYCLFPTDQPLNISWFSVCSHVLYYKFHLLNEKIKENCAPQFSNFPDMSCNLWSSTDTLNALFELELLLAMLEDSMNRNMIVELNDQTKNLHEKLKFTQSFLKAVITDMPQQQKEIDGLKECVIPIRSITAEAQFLIKAFAKEQFPVWYTTLRLCNVITKIDVVGERFPEINKFLLIQVPVNRYPTEFSHDTQSEENRKSSAFPSIRQLSKYLTGLDSRGKFTSRVKQPSDQSLPWKGLSCLAVVCYVLKVCSDSKDNNAVMDTVRCLDNLSSKYQADHVQKERQISEMFVKSFMPNAQKYFTFQKRSIPGSNVEHLAGFIHFLLQILNSEADHIQHEQGYLSLQKELTFLFTILGDRPFQFAEFEEVQNLLEEFETVVNEAGTFIFSYAFPTPPVNLMLLSECTNVLTHKFYLLSANIKDHCARFSMLPKVSGCPKNTTDVVDSFFIVESLLADLENLMNSGFHLNDDVKDQIEELQEKLMSARSFLMLHEREILGVKEHIVQIRDAAYEAEYIINSFVSEDVPIWYVTLRLHNVIPKFNIIVEAIGEINKVCDIQVREAPEESMVIGDSIFVGCKDESTQILDELTGGSKSLQTISIFGMPGVGKTTLAKKVYNDPIVTHYFHKRAWCVVSQTYQKKKVLTDILISLRSMLDKEMVLKMEEDSLISAIYKNLKGKRFLIVVDDVWSSDVWNELGRFFPGDGIGSRILFTSRVSDVAPKGSNSIIHTLPLMPEDKCWELFEKKMFRGENCPKQLVNIGKQIAAQCNGLPLVVVVVAGVLENMQKNEIVWEKVVKRLDSYKSNCMKILELSYKHLPDRLKLCFLYLGVFPEDTEISAKKLKWLWIAEGFIPKEEGKSPEYVANEYLNCLIRRSLVFIARTKSTGEIKACTVHDLLREICLRKAQEKNFLTLVNNDHFFTYEKQQRLCVLPKDLGYLRPISLHCRSFFGYLSDPSSCFPQMKNIRVMQLPRNIEDVGFFYKLRRLDLLVRLRYLIVDRLPESILSNLVNLEFLHIDSLSDEVYLPLTILKMMKLRHLHVRKRVQFERGCDISQTNNLETLSFYNIYHPKAIGILKCSPNLRKLKCMCVVLLCDFRFLTKLESLRVGVEGIFRISGNSTVSLPSSIRKLTLVGILLPWEKMTVIGRLPNLQVLKLLKDAFVGEEWETSDDEFQKLKFLKLQELQFKKWIAWGEHFPKLEQLVLNRCEKLQKIPSALGDIPTLQMIEVHNCSDDASISALEIEDEQHDNGNEELKVIITNDRWSKQQLLSKYTEEQDNA